MFDFFVIMVQVRSENLVEGGNYFFPTLLELCVFTFHQELAGGDCNGREKCNLHIFHSLRLQLLGRPDNDFHLKLLGRPDNDFHLELLGRLDNDFHLKLLGRPDNDFHL